jgi:hypothetical protein
VPCILSRTVSAITHNTAEAGIWMGTPWVELIFFVRVAPEATKLPQATYNRVNFDSIGVYAG